MKCFICEHCKNLVEMLHESGVPMVCCGQNMTELIPNTTDASGEKHVPVFTAEGGTVTVKVGSITHPMQDAHHIVWIAVETNCGVYRANLDPIGAPEASFTLRGGETLVAAYAYCNLHGLWKAEA